MPDDIMRYELPPTGITLLGYIVRRMHKTHWLKNISELVSAARADEALTQIALYAVTSSTSFGRAYYQPRFNSVGEEISEEDPRTGAMVRARLEASSPTYLISYSAIMPNGDIFSGREQITGTTFSLRGLGMPAPSKFNFKSGNYTAELAGILTSELALSLIGRTSIRAYGSLNMRDSVGNAGKVGLNRQGHVNISINNQPAVAYTNAAGSLLEQGK